MVIVSEWIVFIHIILYVLQLLCERLHKVNHQSQAAMAEKEPADKDHNKDTIAAFMAFIKQGASVCICMCVHTCVCIYKHIDCVMEKSHP